MAMPDDLMQGWRDAFTVRRVFGEAIEKDGVTVIPVAAVAAGGGGGGGSAPGGGDVTQEGSGGGFGGMARPAGVYVVRADSVEWMPALDVTKIALAGMAFAALLTMTVRSMFRHHHHW